MDRSTLDREIDNVRIMAEGQLHVSVPQAQQIAELLTDEDFSLLDRAWLYATSLDLYLSESAPREAEQRLVLSLTRRLGPGRKSKLFNRPYLSVTWDVTPAFSVTLYNYQPPSCRIVKQTRIIPAQPERTEEYESLICDQGEEVTE